MNETLIDRAMTYVKNLFIDDFSGHDYYHTLRVYNTAMRIAQAENADLTTVALAALLHDADDRKLSPKTTQNKDNARRFMRENHVDDETAERICKIIGDISYAGSNSVKPDSIEGKCVQDADRLDAIGAIGIGRAFAYGGNHSRLMHHPDILPRRNMTAEEYRNSNSTTINHFYEKLLNLKDMMNTEGAKAIARERDAYMREFLSEFLDEWDGVK